MSAAAKVVALCFEYGRAGGNFLKRLGSWMDLVEEMFAAPDGDRALEQVLWYILLVVKSVKQEHLEALVERELGPRSKEVIVTIGQQLIAQGRKQGRKEGRKEGRREGEGAALCRLLQQRFGAEVDAGVRRRVARAPLAQIEAWMDRVLSAATLAEVLDHGQEREPARL